MLDPKVLILIFATDGIHECGIGITNYSKNEQLNIKLCNESSSDTDIHNAENNFNFNVNGYNSTCENIDILIAITSSRQNYNNRLMLRASWRSDHNSHTFKQRGILPIFFLGKYDKMSVYREKYSQYDIISKIIDKEMTIFNDIVIMDFEDSVERDTLKFVGILRWISKHCTSAKFIIRMDDHTKVNISSLSSNNYLEGLTDNVETAENVANLSRNKYSLYCVKVNQNVQPKNIPQLQNYNFQYKYIPDYCGNIFIFKPSLAKSWFNCASGTTLFWHMEIFMTGIVAQRMNIKHKVIMTTLFSDVCPHKVAC